MGNWLDNPLRNLRGVSLLRSTVADREIGAQGVGLVGHANAGPRVFINSAWRSVMGTIGSFIVSCCVGYNFIFEFLIVQANAPFRLRLFSSVQFKAYARSKTHAKCTVVPPTGLHPHVKHIQNEQWCPPRLTRPCKTRTKCTVIPPPGLQPHVKHIQTAYSDPSMPSSTIKNERQYFK